MLKDKLLEITNYLRSFANSFYRIDYLLLYLNPAGIYLFKVNNRSTRARCEICSKLIIKTPERRQ